MKRFLVFGQPFHRQVKTQLALLFPGLLFQGKHIKIQVDQDEHIYAGYICDTVRSDHFLGLETLS